ncbi:MAG: putative transport system permease protein [Acidobacteriota bacterium]|jgi:putative ABC transport system permease protein|nr:putative transport system permease protein [Acidobacteriota bacterium]
MIRNYLKVALKVLARRKFFTFISLFGISITMLVLLVATAIFDHSFAPQAPETRSERTLGVYRLTMKGPENTQSSDPGYGFLDRYARPLAKLPGVEKVSILSSARTAASYVGGKKIESQLRHTDGEFWQVLDFEFLEGGPFSVEDERGARFVAVINEATRGRFFDGQPALGKTIEVDGQRFRVVGVVRNVPQLRFASSADVWVPTSTSKSGSYKEQWMSGFSALILARDRADLPAIKTEFQALLRQAEHHLPDPKSYKTLISGADTLFEGMVRKSGPGDTDERRPETVKAVLFLLMLLFMLLPTLNLVNINLSRILDRASEIGVRKAFGASSRTLVGQFVVENLVLTLLGAVAGVLLAIPVLAALNASGFLPYARLGLNFRVFLYGLAMAVFFGVFSGVYPAWRMSKLHPVQALRGRSV